MSRQADQIARVVHLSLEFNRAAADGAVLNVALAAGGAIHQGGEIRAAVGTSRAGRSPDGWRGPPAGSRIAASHLDADRQRFKHA